MLENSLQELKHRWNPKTWNKLFMFANDFVILAGARVRDFLLKTNQALVLLHGIEHILSLDGFKPVLQLTRELNHLATRRHAIVILTLVPGRLEDKEEAALSLECRPLYGKELPPL